MARGQTASQGRAAKSEYSQGLRARAKALLDEAQNIEARDMAEKVIAREAAERIQAFYNPDRKDLFSIGLKANVNEHRQFARSVLQDAFASSPYSELGLPDSQYAMDALDTMQGMAERWAKSGKAPSMAEAKEFREIAKRAVQSMNDELSQEAKYLAAEYLRERDNGMGRSARSEAGGGTPTQPNGSPTKYPKMRESLRLLGAGLPTLGGKSTTQDFAFGQLNNSFGKVAYGVDLRDLPDSNELGDTVAQMSKKLNGFIKNPASATDEAIAKYHKSVASAAKRIFKLAERDELS